MTSVALQRHPSADSAISRVTVEITRPEPGRLALRYRVTDPTAALVVPAQANGARKDDLWKRTCFEAFICIPGGEAYYELNLSPSTEWAAYRFDGFRAGMAMADPIDTPRLVWTRTSEGAELSVLADLSGLAGLPADAPWRMGLTAVIEDTPGQLSYWALTHPPDVQDFHNAAGWTARV